MHELVPGQDCLASNKPFRSLVQRNAPHDAVPLGHPRLDAPLDVADVVVDVGAGVDEGRLAPRLPPRGRWRIVGA